MEYLSFRVSTSPSNEYSELISFRIEWFDLFAVQGTLKSLLQHHSSKSSVLQIFKGMFHAMMGSIKDRNSKDLTKKQKRLKRGSKNTQKNYTKKILMTQTTMMV